MLENIFQSCLNKQLYDMFKRWCEWGVILLTMVIRQINKLPFLTKILLGPGIVRVTENLKSHGISKVEKSMIPVGYCLASFFFLPDILWRTDFFYNEMHIGGLGFDSQLELRAFSE